MGIGMASYVIGGQTVYSRTAEYPQDCCISCPCTYTDESEMAQNYGCLPDQNRIIERYLNNEGAWQCHSKKGKVCGGLKTLLKENNIPMNKNNKLLIDGDNDVQEGHHEEDIQGKDI